MIEIPIRVIAAEDDDELHCVRCGSTKRVRTGTHHGVKMLLCFQCAVRAEYRGTVDALRGRLEE